MNWLVRHRLVRPWAVLRVQLLMTLKWVRSPSVYLTQMYVTLHYDTCLFNLPWLILKREWIYIGWANGEVEYVDRTNPTLGHYQYVIDRFTGKGPSQ